MSRGKNVRIYIKRTLDILLSLLLLTILIIPLAIIYLFVKLESKGPAIFKQERPGKNIKAFTIYKFRTMALPNSINCRYNNDKGRITSFGHYLRKNSLDELPELWNVLKGDMSLVGPRPLLLDYLARYSPVQARRHEVVPGITGWAQVNGRNAITWEEKFDYDVWYVDNWSIGLDLKILWKTVVKVIRREGISHTGEATMPEFKGNNSKLSS